MSCFSGRQTRRALLRNASVLAGWSVLVKPACLFAQPASGDLVVSAPVGTFRGVAEGGVRVFRGVPFAEPPVGPLRFRPSVALRPAPGVRDATRFAAEAMQKAEAGIARSEDCLYLNVWAPAGKGPHPIFVWIHGDGFTGGHAFAPIFDGAGFARAGVLVVTVAYRLGVFGFMDLEPILGPSYADSANNGTRDLMAALRWVHENIAGFGGDSTQVTLGGESAGAKVVAALMAVPESAAMFRSVISQSGGGERVLTREQAAGVSHDFASLWKQSGNSSADMRSADAAALIDVQEKLLAGSAIHFPFRQETGGNLLPKRPIDLIAGDLAKRKRMLIGSNRDESALFLGPHPDGRVKRSDLGNVPLDVFSGVVAKYASLYPAMSLPQHEIRSVTAEEYWIPTVRLAEANAGNGGDTWMYRLDYARTTGRMAGEAYHSEDLGLMWDALSPEEAQDTQMKALGTQMQTAWIAFMKGKAPGADGLPSWPQFDKAKRATMILDRVSRVEGDPNAAERRLWTGVL